MSEYRETANQIAKEYGIPPQLFRALITQESGWNPRARSPVGAYGFTQLMPATARELGVNPYDPIQNLRGGAKYLRQQIDRFHSIPLALAAYNAGPGAVRKYGGIPPYRETQNYVKKVMRMYNGVDTIPGSVLKKRREFRHTPVAAKDKTAKIPTFNLRIEMYE